MILLEGDSVSSMSLYTDSDCDPASEWALWWNVVRAAVTYPFIYYLTHFVPNGAVGGLLAQIPVQAG